MYCKAMVSRAHTASFPGHTLHNRVATSPDAHLDGNAGGILHPAANREHKHVHIQDPARFSGEDAERSQVQSRNYRGGVWSSEMRP